MKSVEEIEDNFESIPFDSNLVNMVRGKSIQYVGDTGKEIRVLCRMLDWFEFKLDGAQCENIFGEGGWREYFGLEGSKE